MARINVKNDDLAIVEAIKGYGSHIYLKRRKKPPNENGWLAGSLHRPEGRESGTGQAFFGETRLKAASELLKAYLGDNAEQSCTDVEDALRERFGNEP